MEGLDALEQAVLDKLLAGDLAVLETLRAQAVRARLVSKENTGVGFFCDFDVSFDAPLLAGDFHIGDVNGQLKGLKHGAGFVLFVRDGRLDSLEGFSYDEPWPDEIMEFTLTYQGEERDIRSG